MYKLSEVILVKFMESRVRGAPFENTDGKMVIKIGLVETGWTDTDLDQNWSLLEILCVAGNVVKDYEFHQKRGYLKTFRRFTHIHW
jgi:hypothetical protein